MTKLTQGDGCCNLLGGDGCGGCSGCGFVEGGCGGGCS